MFLRFLVVLVSAMAVRVAAAPFGHHNVHQLGKIAACGRNEAPLQALAVPGATSGHAAALDFAVLNVYIANYAPLLVTLRHNVTASQCADVLLADRRATAAACGVALHVASLVVTTGSAEVLPDSAYEIALELGAGELLQRVLNVGDADADGVDNVAVFSARHNGTVWAAFVRVIALERALRDDSPTPIVAHRVVLAAPIDTVFACDADGPLAVPIESTPALPIAPQLVDPAYLPIALGADVHSILLLGVPTQRAVYAVAVSRFARNGTDNADTCALLPRAVLVRQEASFDGFGMSVFDMVLDQGAPGVLVTAAGGTLHAYALENGTFLRRPDGTGDHVFRVLAIANDEDANGADELIVGLEIDVLAGNDSSALTPNATRPRQRGMIGHWFLSRSTLQTTGVDWTHGALDSAYVGSMVRVPSIRSVAKMTPFGKHASMIDSHIAITCVSDANASLALAFTVGRDVSRARNCDVLVPSNPAETERLQAKFGSVVAVLPMFLRGPVEVSPVDEARQLFLLTDRVGSASYLIRMQREVPQLSFVDDLLPDEQVTVLAHKLVSSELILFGERGEHLWLSPTEGSLAAAALPFVQQLRLNDDAYERNATSPALLRTMPPFEIVSTFAFFPRNATLPAPFGDLSDVQLLAASGKLSALAVRGDLTNIVVLLQTERNVSVVLQYPVVPSRVSSILARAPMVAIVPGATSAAWTKDLTFLVVTTSAGIVVLDQRLAVASQLSFGGSDVTLRSSIIVPNGEELYYSSGANLYVVLYSSWPRLDPNLRLLRRLTLPGKIGDVAACPSGVQMYVALDDGTLVMLTRANGTDWTARLTSRSWAPFAGASSLLAVGRAASMLVLVSNSSLVALTGTCVLPPPLPAMQTAVERAPATDARPPTESVSLSVAASGDALSFEHGLAIMAAAAFFALCVLVPVCVCLGLRWAPTRRPLERAMRAVMPDDMVNVSDDAGDDGDRADFDVGDTAALSPRSAAALSPRGAAQSTRAMSGKSSRSFTGLWKRHARTIDLSKTWREKLLDGPIASVASEEDVVRHSQDGSPDDTTMFRFGTTMKVLALNAALSNHNTRAIFSPLDRNTVPQQATLRRFVRTGDFAQAMKGGDYALLERLLLTEALATRRAAADGKDWPALRQPLDKAMRDTASDSSTRSTMGGGGGGDAGRTSTLGARRQSNGVALVQQKPLSTKAFGAPATPIADFLVLAANEELQRFAKPPPRLSLGRRELRCPKLRVSKLHLDFGLAAGELAPVQRPLSDSFEIANDGTLAMLVTMPLVSSPFCTIAFSPGVFSVAPGSMQAVSVRLTLTRPSSVSELIDFVVCDVVTLFLTVAFDPKLQTDIDPKALRFGQQLTRSELVRTFEAQYAGRRCAVKVLHDAAQYRSEDGTLRLVPEHRLLLKFIGSCEVGADGVEPYRGMIVMEATDYGPLSDIVHNPHRSISFRLYLRIVSDVLAALAHLHSVGFVHGMLRPSCVLLSSLSARADSVAKVSDYALWSDSPRTGGGAGAGATPAPELALYMAPEQLDAERRRCRAASDVFSFGLLLYEAFVRELPYLDAESPFQVTEFKLCGRAPGPRLPGAPEGLARAIGGCLGARARARMSVAELSDELDALIADAESGASHVEPMPPTERTEIDVSTAYRSLERRKTQAAAVEHVLLAESELVVSDVVGRGAFGDVYQGVWRKTVPVAIKTVRSDATSGAELADLLAEANLLMTLPAHPCIVTVYGLCVSSTRNLWLIMELLENGSLLSMLRTERDSDDNARRIRAIEMVAISQDIVSGMLHLEHNGIIHRDLAARNVLIGAETSTGYHAKVSDFGLSLDSDTYVADVDANRKRPVKWTSPEALRSNKYSAASDVWSFGVLLWEMVTYGVEPYPTMTPQEVFVAVQKGHRLEAPLNCPDFLREIMQSCWEEEPSARPTWAAILDRICDLSDDDVLALRIANPTSAAKQIEETLDRGRALRRASRYRPYDVFESCDSSGTDGTDDTDDTDDNNLFTAAAMAPLVSRVPPTFVADASSNYIDVAAAAPPSAVQNPISSKPRAGTAIVGAAAATVSKAAAAAALAMAAPGSNYIAVESAVPAASPPPAPAKSPLAKVLSPFKMAQTAILPGATANLQVPTTRASSAEILQSLRRSSANAVSRSSPMLAPTARAQQRRGSADTVSSDGSYDDDYDDDDADSDDDERLIPKDSHSSSVSVHSPGHRKGRFSISMGGGRARVDSSSDSSTDERRHTFQPLTVGAVLGQPQSQSQQQQQQQQQQLRANNGSPALTRKASTAGTVPRNHSVGTTDMRFDLTSRSLSQSGGKAGGGKAVSADDDNDDDPDNSVSEEVLPKRAFSAAKAKSFALTGVLDK